MSVLKHPTLPLWHRDERGDYHAEILGWILRVTWIPVTHRKRGTFAWSAEPPGGTAMVGRKTFEEPEMAMSAAEQAVAPYKKRPGTIDKAGDELPIHVAPDLGSMQPSERTGSI